jgi:hypothetical protein
MRRRLNSRSRLDPPLPPGKDVQTLSLSQAKEILRAAESKKSGNISRKEVLGEYNQVLNLVVDAILKLSTEDEVRKRRDESTQCSVTVPETIATADDCSVDFDVYGTGYPSEEPTEPWPLHNKNENRPVRMDDDEWSVSSDTLPLYMADEDAFDESEFCQVMMGYAHGFVPERIDETQYIEDRLPLRRNWSGERPPLPRPSHMLPPIKKTNRTHRTRGSGNSAPAALEALKKEGLWNGNHAGGSNKGRAAKSWCSPSDCPSRYEI